MDRVIIDNSKNESFTEGDDREGESGNRYNGVDPGLNDFHLMLKQLFIMFHLFILEVVEILSAIRRNFIMLEGFLFCEPFLDKVLCHFFSSFIGTGCFRNLTDVKIL